MNTLSLETAKALKAAGYPQDQWPQMVWWKTVLGEDVWDYDFWHNDMEGQFGTAVEYVSRPDPLTALDWLEKKGWMWKRGHWGAPLWAAETANGDRLTADTADALSIAICERLAQSSSAPAY